MYGGGVYSDISRACVAAGLLCAVSGCAASNVLEDVTSRDAVASRDAFNSVRNADFRARFPASNEGRSEPGGEAPKPLLFPGAEVEPEPQRDQDPAMRTASLQPAAFVRGDGVEINFDGADVQTVAKTLLGDVLKLNFVVDPRVQGNVTLASAGPIPRKDVLPAFESVLRMSNAAIVRDGNLSRSCRFPRPAPTASVSMGAGRTGLRRFAGAVAIHLGGDGGEDGGGLSVAARRDPRRSHRAICC